MKINNNEHGFVLIDSLFAITVTTVALFSIIGLITMGTKTYMLNTEQSRAYQVASSFGDCLQSVPAETWQAAVQSSDYQTIDVTTATFSSFLTNAQTSLGNFKTAFPTAKNATVAVSAMLSPAPNISSRLAQVKITVTWNQGKNRAQLVKYYVRDSAPQAN